MISNKQELALADLTSIYAGRANGLYGLTLVNQLAHAVQSAYHARAAGLLDSVVVAALLHDIGHMVHSLGEHPAALGIDDHHEKIGANWLERYFGSNVTEPIRLHVAAKRYLCTVEADYFSKLSKDSVESLTLQGGPMSDEEATRFAAMPHADNAVSLRRWDDLGKDIDKDMNPLDEFRRLLHKHFNNI